jgi:hypothetical protein
MYARHILTNIDSMLTGNSWIEVARPYKAEVNRLYKSASEPGTPVTSPS